mgnify:CR=1 FL=1
MTTAAQIAGKKLMTELDRLRMQKCLLLARMACDSTYLYDRESAEYSSKLEGMVSMYGASNHMESFAENFTMTSLERAGREDLKVFSPGINPSSRHTMLHVDSLSFFIMSRIVDAVNQADRRTDQFLRHIRMVRNSPYGKRGGGRIRCCGRKFSPGVQHFSGFRNRVDRIHRGDPGAHWM